MNRILRRNILCALIGSLFVGFFMATPAQAAENTFLLKASLAGLQRCYQSNAYRGYDEDGRFTLTSYRDAKWLVVDEDAREIYLPTGTTAISDNSPVDCKEVLFGKTEGWFSPHSVYSGLYALYGKTLPESTSDLTEINDFLIGMGYVSNSESKGQCIRITYKGTIVDPESSVGNIEGDYITTLCAEDIQNGKINVDEMKVSRQSGPAVANSLTFDVASGKVTCKKGSSNWLGIQVWKDIATVNFEKGVTTWDEFVSNLFSNECIPESIFYISSSHYNFQRGEITYPPSNEIITTYGLDSNSIETALQYFGGNSSNSIKLTTNEKVSLLQYYLDSYYKIDKRCGIESNSTEAAMATGDKYISTTISDGGSAKSCYIKAKEHQNDSVQIWDSRNMLSKNVPKTFDEVLQLLRDLLGSFADEQKNTCNSGAEAARNEAQSILDDPRSSEIAKQNAQTTIDELDALLAKGEYWYADEDTGNILCYSFHGVDGDLTTTETETPGDGSNTETDTGVTIDGDEIDACYGSAGALGWIICPVLDAVSAAVDGIYEEYVQSSFLEIKSSNMSRGTQIYETWKTIRNIANVIFVIAFIIIIFSQLTGLGIKNYGIKVILPRLIIVVVLVNISFLLCQVAVDFSNILGYGLYSMFNGLGSGISYSISGGETFGNSMGSAAALVGIAVLAAQTASAWLIPVLLTLISCAFSIIFAALILAIRQAGVIILAVLAPIAIVCYSLPNSKSIFDKWLKAFTSLLLVFPLCGALMGAGNFAASLILTATNTGIFVTMVAMLLRVVPFFFIPSVVRSSLVTLGNIGTKVSNFGSKFGRMASGAAGKTNAVERLDANLHKLKGDSLMRRGNILSQITKKPMSARRQAKAARQYSRYNKLYNEEAIAVGAGAYAVGRNSLEYGALRDDAHYARISKMAKAFEGQETDIATDVEAVQAKYDEALAAYNNNQTDENEARMQAYANMLNTIGDKGHDALYDSLTRTVENGHETAFRAASRHLIREHTKDIKPTARDLFTLASKGANRNNTEIQRGSFADGAQGHAKLINESIGGYDAASFARIDETALDRMIANADNLSTDAKQSIEKLSRGALSNSNIHVQDKVASKMNELRTRLGMRELENNSSNGNTDSGRINIQGNSQSDGSRISTGNDIRRSQFQNHQIISGQSVFTGGLAEGNDYRTQGDSNIVLPPSYGRQSKSQGSSGGNGGQGPNNSGGSS